METKGLTPKLAMDMERFQSLSGVFVVSFVFFRDKPVRTVGRKQGYCKKGSNGIYAPLSFKPSVGDRTGRLLVKPGNGKKRHSCLFYRTWGLIFSLPGCSLPLSISLSSILLLPAFLFHSFSFSLASLYTTPLPSNLPFPPFVFFLFPHAIAYFLSRHNLL